MNGIFCDTVNSTQLKILEYIDVLDDNDYLIAKKQTAGYGVTGLWDSRSNNLYYSQIVNNKYSYIGIRVIVAVYLSLIDIVSDTSKLKVKLPNDIFYDGLKLGGIIIERQYNKYIVGVGINIEQEKDDIKTSIRVINGTSISVKELASILNIKIIEALNYSEDELYDRWIISLNIIGKKITFIDRLSNIFGSSYVNDINFFQLKLGEEWYSIDQIKLIDYK